jgi:hypothetical protein
MTASYERSPRRRHRAVHRRKRHGDRRSAPYSSDPGSPQLPIHVHSPSTHAGVPHKQLKAPVQPPLGGGFAARHVPVHVGGIEWVQATTEQNSPVSQPVVTGGLPVTLQRRPSASVVVSVDPSSMSAAEHPSDASNAPSATAVKPNFARVCMMVQGSLVLVWSTLLTSSLRASPRKGYGVRVCRRRSTGKSESP